MLLIATLYQFSDALQVSIAGALRGYKDTRIIMAVTLVSHCGVGMGLVNLLDRSVPGVFEGLSVSGISVAAALLGWWLTPISGSHLLAGGELQEP